MYVGMTLVLDHLKRDGLNKLLDSHSPVVFLNSPASDIFFSIYEKSCADQPLLQLGFDQSMTPTYSCEAECSNQMVTSVVQNNHPMQVFNPTLRSNSFSLADFISTHYNGEPNWYPNSSEGALVTSGQLPPASDTFYQVTSTFAPTTAPLVPSNELLFASSGDDAENGIYGPLHSFVHISPKVRWCKIRAAVKWWLSVRQLAARRMAARRMTRPLYLDY